MPPKRTIKTRSERTTKKRSLKTKSTKPAKKRAPSKKSTSKVSSAKKSKVSAAKPETIPITTVRKAPPEKKPEDMTKAELLALVQSKKSITEFYDGPPDPAKVFKKPDPLDSDATDEEIVAWANKSIQLEDSVSPEGMKYYDASGKSPKRDKLIHHFSANL